MNINSYKAIDLVAHFPNGWIPERLHEIISVAGRPSKYSEKLNQELLKVGFHRTMRLINYNYRVKHFSAPEFGLTMLPCFYSSSHGELINNFSFREFSIDDREALRRYMRPRASCELFHIVFKYAEKYQYKVLVRLLHYLYRFERMPYVDVGEVKGKEIVFDAMRFGIEPVLSCWAEVLHEADAYHLF